MKSFHQVFEIANMSAITAGAPVFALRFNNVRLKLARIRQVAMWCVTTTAFTADQIVEYHAHKARAFTAMDTGGTALDPTKFKPNGLDGASLATEARIGALVAGTRVLDEYPFADTQGWSGNTGQTLNRINSLVDLRHSPVELEYGQGLVINNVRLLGAAGVIKLHIEIDWEEFRR